MQLFLSQDVISFPYSLYLSLFGSESRVRLYKDNNIHSRVADIIDIQCTKHSQSQSVLPGLL